MPITNELDQSRQELLDLEEEQGEKSDCCFRGLATRVNGDHPVIEIPIRPRQDKASRESSVDEERERFPFDRATRQVGHLSRGQTWDCAGYVISFPTIGRHPSIGFGP